jgi:hypothetical protein
MLMMLICWEESLVAASKETGLEVNADKTGHVLRSECRKKSQ